MPQKRVYRDTETVVIKEGAREQLVDQVAVERPVTIFLNGQEIITLLCTPEKLEQLAVGFLYSEGFLKGKEDIGSVRLEEEEGLVYVESRGDISMARRLYDKRTRTTGCGKGTVFFSAWDSLKSRRVQSELRVSQADLRRHMRDLQDRSILYRQTGGAHSTALCNTGEVLLFCEDVGRHNALDKIAGQCLQEEIPLEDKLLVCSGRLSSEMLLKAAKLGIPLLASRAAPTTLAVQMALSVEITLVGFLRGRRMTVYSFPERLIADSG